MQLGAAGCRALTKQTEPVRQAPEAPGRPAVPPCGQISFVPSTARGSPALPHLRDTGGSSTDTEPPVPPPLTPCLLKGARGSVLSAGCCCCGVTVFP